MARQRPAQDLELELGGTVFPLVQNSATARQILRDTGSNYSKYYGTYEQLFGVSRLTTDGIKWRQLRAYSQPYITETNPDAVVRTAREYFLAAAQGILASAQGGSAQVEKQIDFAAAATVCKLVLGFPIEDWGPETISDIRHILRLASFENFPQPSTGYVEHAMLKIDAEDAKARLTARFSALVAHRSGRSEGSMIDALANAEPNEVDIFGELSTLLFAGFDTTASAITWAMFLLGKDKALQDRLRQSVRGLFSQQTISANDLTGLVDLNAFLLETLRIFPPIPLVSRIAVGPQQIGDLHIKQGKRVLVSIIGIQQDPAIFHDPMRVDLSRHPEGALSKSGAANFVPFGDGRRVCPGSRFANLEALTALAVFLETMSIQTPHSDRIALRWDASMRQADGTKLVTAAVV